MKAVLQIKIYKANFLQYLLYEINNNLELEKVFNL